MKKISKYFLLVAIIMFIGLLHAKASMTYTIYECSPFINQSTDYSSDEIIYHLANHDPDPICRFNAKIVLDSYSHGDSDDYNDLGGDEDLDNADLFTDHYPKFIVVNQVYYPFKNVIWTGADSIGKARSIYADKWYPSAIFISEKYLSALKSNVNNFDNTIHKTCIYEDGDITLNFNKDGYYVGGAQYKLLKGSNYLLVKLWTEFVEQPHLEIQSGGCPKLYMCYKDQHYNIFSDSTQAVNKCEGKKVEKKWTAEGTGACGTYVLMKQQMSTYYSNSDKTQYNRLKDELSNLCKGVVSQSNYVDNNNFVDPCIKSCLDLNKDIAAIEGKPVGTNSCGFSEKLLAWIVNILRWVKYIVPVLLIILSILDFIKAMASEKDDDMKKAQKHFVTRLIVAVLIFIMPLIIEFVLDKMGFSADSCGIRSLGLGE